MAFVTTSLRETQTELEWIVEWDGAPNSPVLTAASSFWTTSIQLTLAPPDANGARSILGVDVFAAHKQGPHLDDVNPGNSVQFRLDALKIFQDYSTTDTDRGTKTAVHATSAASHEDEYKLATHILRGQNNVTIKLRAKHGAAQAGSSTGTALGTPAPASSIGAPSGPPLAPPREGTGKSFTFVEKTDYDNGYDFFSGLIRFGEVDVASVKDMVDHILSNLGEGECIKEITLIAHGAPGNISVGNGDEGSERGKEISANDPSEWRSDLLKLRCKFCKDSTVYLRGCNVGADDAGARLLQMLNETFQCAGKVQAPTGLCYPDRVEGDTQEAVRGATSKPKAMPAPKKKKAKKKKNQGSKTMMFAGTRNSAPVFFDPIDILDMRYFPRIVGQEFSPELAIPEHTTALPRPLIAAFRSALGACGQIDGANAGLKSSGLLQISVSQDGEARVLPAWTVYGGGQYVAPLGGETSILFELEDPLAASFAAFVETASYG